MQAMRSTIEARAELWDLLSIAFSYPGPGLTDLAFDRGFPERIRRLVSGSPPHGDVIRQAVSELVRWHEGFSGDAPRVQLETDYLSLFELNRDEPPLHLNGHLYVTGKPDPVPVHERLIVVYRRFGIELRGDGPVESPDHLTVQLEFLSYLFRLLARLLEEGDPGGIQEAEREIDGWYSELEWVGTWLPLLEKRTRHPFYCPLARLLWALLQERYPVGAFA